MGFFSFLFMISIMIFTAIGVLFTTHHAIQFLYKAPEMIDRYMEQHIERVLNKRNNTPKFQYFELGPEDLQQKSINYRVLRTRET